MAKKPAIPAAEPTVEQRRDDFLDPIKSLQPQWEPAVPAADTAAAAAKAGPEDDDDDDVETGTGEPPAPEPVPPIARKTVVAAALRERGFNIADDDDDDAILAEMETLAKRAGTMPSDDELAHFRQNAPVLGEYEQNKKEFNEFLAAKRAAGEKAAPVAEAAQPKTKRPKLEYDADWESHAKFDAASGQYVPKNTWSNPAAVEKLNKYSDSLRQSAREVAADPFNAVKPELDEYLTQRETEIEKRIVALIESQATQTRSLDQLDQFFVKNEAKFFEMDENGHVKVDPQTNQAVLKPAGTAYRDAAVYAQQQFGLNPDKSVDDRIKIHQFALREAERLDSAVKPAPVKGEKKKSFLERARKTSRDDGRLPERDGTVQAAINGGPQQSRFAKLDWNKLREEAVAEMEANGN